MTAAPQLAIVPAHARWISTDAAIEHTGWTDRWLRAKAASGAIVSREGGRASNGRPTREYLEASLPPKPAPLAIVPKTTQFGPLFASLPFPSERIVLPDPESQAQAEQRLAILQPIIDYPADPARYTALTLPDGRNVTSLERMIEYVSIGAEVSPRTLKRWLAAYRSSFAALADRVRADKGRSRWFERHQQAKMLAAYLYLVERQSVTFVCEQIERDAEQLGIEAADLPSRETVRVFLSAEISPAMKALAREGQREYRERMAPYIKRGYVDVWANQIWVGDHMIHDVEVANDLFDDAPFGSPVRLRLSAMLDYRSRKLVGATWCWEGSSRAIAATMRRAILQFGPPEGIYVDNGKDYIKVAKGAHKGSETWLNESPLAPGQWWQSELEQIERTGFLARLGIAVTHCIPRHPQSKHVERFFRTLHTRFDSAHPTYTSGSPATRPDQTEAAMMLHRRLLKKGRVAESSHPLASRFILGCLSWIEEYNSTPHSGEGMDGRSPNEVFTGELNPDQKPAPEPATLALLMAEYERRQVHECAVTLSKRRYTPRPEDRLAWAAMHECNEREILVAYDPGDPECAAALTLDGHFIAWLEAEQLLRFAPGDAQAQQQIGQSMEIRRGLEKATKTTLRAIATAARSNGARSAEEMLYDRLQLPASTTPVISQRKPRLRPDKNAVASPTAADIASNILEALK
jgi:putative transposase